MQDGARAGVGRAGVGSAGILFLVLPTVLESRQFKILNSYFVESEPFLHMVLLSIL
jgi:hypothetical protein